MEDDDNTCYICYNQKAMKDFKCKICKKTLCMECFCQINKSKFDVDEGMEIIKFKCPFCCVKSKYSFDDFNKYHLIKLFRHDLSRIFNMYIFNPEKKIGKLLKKIDNLKENNEYMEEMLYEKDDEIEELKAIIEKQKQDLKALCFNDGNKKSR